ncbi:cysteine-rich venom protein DIS2-like [Bufo gargarizans]|uniref:cysteine-rich venom protein DIS2-like n=1 Tax=Bufo gargarizans TaxID=30331 RepID=UPI001CF0D7CA|nr:cysteine-rich venom protein DIS2-like [Bufo gargarizans]
MPKDGIGLPSLPLGPHPELFSCGENLYLSTSKDSWEKIIGEWNTEYKYFIYGGGKRDPGKIVGHITQVIWANSYQVGCAAAYCENLGMFLVVCHYCPAGNDPYTLYTPYESGPWCSKCTGDCEKKLCVV